MNRGRQGGKDTRHVHPRSLQRFSFKLKVHSIVHRAIMLFHGKVNCLMGSVNVGEIRKGILMQMMIIQEILKGN